MVTFLGLSLVVNACSGAGSGSTPAKSGGTATTATAAAAGNPNGIVTYGYDLSASFTNTFDPGKSNGDCDQIPLSLIYDTIMHRDPSGKLLPGLATSVVQDGRTITVHLRSGVTFSDNEPFDSTAVKNGLLHNQKNSQLTSLAPIASMDTPDPLTLVVHYKDDTGVEFVGAMGGRDGYIVAPNAIASGTADKKPIGAGPFVLSNYQPGASISVRPNPTYWDKGRYKFAGVDFVQVGVGPPSLTALRSGSVDMVTVDAAGFSQFHGGQSGLDVAVQNTTAYLQFQFRFVKPFDNVMVRQAVLYAINRDEINRVVEVGQGEVATQEFPKNSVAYDPSLANLYPFNPDKAKQLLAQAGYPNGLDVEVAIPGGNISEMEQQGNIVQQELAAVGIRMKITRILGSDIATQYYIAGTGQAFLASRLGSTYPPDQVYSGYGKDQFVAIWSKGENPDITALMLQALKLGRDPQAFELTKQADKLIMQQALEAPIAFRPEFMAYRTTKLGGTVHAQTDICDPADLTSLFVKK